VLLPKENFTSYTRPMTQITSELTNQVLLIRFNRPEKMNAITRDMYADLARLLNDANGDFGIRAVVLSSVGDHFTAGNDIMDFMSNPPTSEDSTVAAFLGSLLNFTKPLIAAVKGHAVGVGTTMLLHCDVVVASESAKFSMPFTSLGLVPERDRRCSSRSSLATRELPNLPYRGGVLTSICPRDWLDCRGCQRCRERGDCNR